MRFPLGALRRFSLRAPDRSVLALLAAPILAETLCCVASALLLRRLGAVLRQTVPAFPKALGPVLAALGTAYLQYSPVVPFLLCFAGAAAPQPLLVSAGLSRGRRIARIVAAVLLGVLVWLAALALTLWLTEVNGIRFGDMLRTLYRLRRGGGLRALL